MMVLRCRLRVVCLVAHLSVLDTGRGARFHPALFALRRVRRYSGRFLRACWLAWTKRRRFLVLREHQTVKPSLLLIGACGSTRAERGDPRGGSRPRTERRKP